MTRVLSPTPKLKFFNNNGAPLVAGRLFTYAAGTSTKLATYQSEGGSENSNPVVLDFRGEANVWIPANTRYKYVLAPPGSDDPPTAPIFTVDNLTSAQLITLYGGVDTGIADAYALTFDGPFDAYEDGIVIFWVPAHSNTGASTLNVNGLGPVSILNQDDSALAAGQLVAGEVSQVMYFDGAFRNLAPSIANQRNHWTAGNSNAWVTLTDGATVTIDCAEGNVFLWTIGGNRTVQFDNEVDGSWVEVAIVQDGTGGREPVWPSNVEWTGDTAPDLSAAANAMDRVFLRYKLSTDTWYGELAVDKPRLFDSPAFTGVPTAPTAAPGTSNTQIATTAFVNAVSDFSTNGTWVGPGGFTVQWGTESFASGSQTVNFPDSFANACLGVSLTIRRTGSASGQSPVVQGNPTTTSFSMRHAPESDGVFWLAWGH